MFKKFDEKEDITGATQLKSSIQVRFLSQVGGVSFSWVIEIQVKFYLQKGIRNKIIELYPHIEPFLLDILPKKVRN